MKSLLICNSIYQVLVSLWMKESILKNDAVDIIISDHMNGYGEIAENLEKSGCFHGVFAVKTKELCAEGLDRSSRFRCITGADKILKRYVNLTEKYDAVFVANLNLFARLLFHTVKNDRKSKFFNKDMKFYLFEDGMSTYSKLFEKYYKECVYPQKHTKLFYKPQTIYNNLSGIYAFDTKAFMWKAEGVELLDIPKIDTADKEFIKTVNAVFGYDKMSDTYDKKYIFMEESFYADTGYNEDVELIEAVAQRVGKENFMIKIHPRNPENRFEKLGYKTNKDTAIPWEVILLNNNFSDRVLLTVASSSVMAPAFLFGQKIKTYVLYDLLKEKPESLKGALWECSQRRFGAYDNIKIVKTPEEII